MKKSWEYKTLGEVAKICGGKRLPKGCKLQSEPTKHKYIRVADFLDNGTVCKDDIQYISDDIFNQIKRYTISSADVYISIAGTIGKSGIVPDELNGANLTENACKLVLNKELDKRFVYLVTISPFFKEQINTLTKKSAQPKLALTRLATVNVPVPPLSEQKEIVEYLDSSFAKIDKLKENVAKNLEEAKALFQSALKDALEPKEGWEEKTLKELTNKISDGSHNPPTGLSYSEYRMLSSKNVRNDNFSFDNPRYLSEDDFQKENKRTQLEKGDVLLTIVGAGLGDCCVYNFDDVIVFQRSVSVLKPNYDKITSRFLMYSMQFRYDDIRKKSNGAAQKGIYLKQLAAYSLKLPSIKEQQSIVSFLDSLNEKVNTLQQNYSRICNECDALKQAILRQVFE